MEEKQVVRSSFLVNLLEEIDLTDPELFTPNTKLEKDETLVGQVNSIYARRIYSLAKYYAREHDQLHLDQHYGGTPNHARHEECKVKRELLYALFWAILTEDCHLWGEPRETGVRQGWQVVVFKPKQKVINLGNIGEILGGITEE